MVIVKLFIKMNRFAVDHWQNRLQNKPFGLISEHGGGFIAEMMVDIVRHMSKPRMTY